MKRFVVCLTLVACSSRTVPPSEPAPVSTPAPIASASVPPPKSKETALLRRIAAVLERAAALRGLPAKHPVAGAVLGRAELLSQLKAHVLKEVPHEVIVREGNGLKLAGAIPKDIDYEAVMFRLLEEQLAGFYSPEDETMSLAGDLDEDMADATLLHELIHALQDQHFDLKPQSKYQPGQSDRSFSRSALAEGDATSAMADFMMGGENQGVPSVEAERTIMLAMQTAMPDFAPPILQRSLIAPYVTGLRFVNARRRAGGWGAVDAAWRNPPVTSEQILHDDKYASHEVEIPVPAPEASSFGPRFVRDDADTSGEQGMQLLFESWLGHRRGAELARGWGGDRGSMVHDDRGAIALVEHLRYDDDARGQAKKLVQALAQAWSLTPQTRAGALTLCKERPDLGPAALVAKSSGDLVMVFGPTKPDTWTSTSTCAAALATARLELER